MLIISVSVFQEVFQHKIDFQVSLYIVAVLDYIAADILNVSVYCFIFLSI